MILPLIDSNTMADSDKLLGQWRLQRALSVGKVFSISGTILATISLIIDNIWGHPFVVMGDLVLLAGCLISLYLFFTVKIDEDSSPQLMGLPLYFGFWVSMWPSLWATGGIQSPLLGLFIFLLYAIGVVLQTRLSSLYFLGFAILNMPFIYFMSLNIASPPLPHPFFTIAMHTLGCIGLAVVMASMLRTERRLVLKFSQRYKELLEARAELRREEEANQAKTTFLANVSHELRTPLSSILGYADLISDDQISNKDRKQHTETIRRNGQQLSKLVDDLLDLTRIEAGNVQVTKTEFRLRDMLTEVLNLVNLAAHKKDIIIEIKYLNEVPEFIYSDQNRFRQILLNIIGNAVKFTESGIVRVGIIHKKGALNIDITDTGRGISETEKLRLFQPFSQGDPSLVRRYGGTGLGLSLSKRLAELLGGNLVLSFSKLDIGSRFTITIPVGDVKNQKWIKEFSIISPGVPFTQKVHDINSKKFDGLNVLFVDDTPDNQRLISIYLKSMGANVELANNGSEGVQKALNNSYDVVLMDLQMPVMDGYEAVKILRHENYKKPILAVTAHAMKEDLDRCMDAGFNGHLTKPLTKNALIKAIKAV